MDYNTGERGYKHAITETYVVIPENSGYNELKII